MFSDFNLPENLLEKLFLLLANGNIKAEIKQHKGHQRHKMLQ